MVRMIRRIRPRGPYRIAGWSFGGLIAYEIAVQLIGAGEEVEFLGLLDTSYPSLKWKAELNLDLAAFDDKKMLLDAIEPRGHGDRVEKLRQAFTELASKSAVMEFDSLVAEAQRMWLLPQRWKDFTVRQVRQLLFSYYVFGLAILNYSAPAQCIPIPAHLFLAEEDRDAEHLRGWSECLPESQIRAISIPGTHHTMMIRPHIEVLGQVLSAAIRNASNEVNKGPVLMAR
jgi:thioesterase domain-containing protein